jgi:hypothetical protein
MPRIPAGCGMTFITFVAAIESDPRFARVVAEPVSALGANVTIWQRQKE